MSKIGVTDGTRERAPALATSMRYDRFEKIKVKTQTGKKKGLMNMNGHGCGGGVRAGCQAVAGSERGTRTSYVSDIY